MMKKKEKRERERKKELFDFILMGCNSRNKCCNRFSCMHNEHREHVLLFYNDWRLSMTDCIDLLRLAEH